MNRILEVLYGGSAGGGKSDAELMASAQYVDRPDYAALILRKTFPDLNQPDGLIPRSKSWWQGKASWNFQEKRWTFPSGATVSFGYLDHADDIYRYQGSAFRFIAFDELTQFTEEQYTYLFSRLRGPTGSDIPLRMRAGSNPGGRGHHFVKQRFIPDEALSVTEDEFFARPWFKGERAFVPARLTDNPHLDIESYRLALAKLDPVTRAQLERGDWKAHEGGRFSRHWFKTFTDLGDSVRLNDTGEVILKADLAFSVVIDPAGRKTKASKFTAIGTFASTPHSKQLVMNVVREHLGLTEIIPRLHSVCQHMRPFAPDWCAIESNGFQMMLVDEAKDHSKYPHIPTVVEIEPEGKSKLTRATPAMIKAEQGEIYVPDEADWKEDFLGELELFTGDEKLDSYTDQVDILAYQVIQHDRYGGDGGEEPIMALERRRW